MKQKEKLWNKNFITACITYFFVAASFHVLVPTIPIYLSQVLNVPQSKIGIVLSSYVIALLFFRPFSGFLVDIYSRKSLLIIGLIFFCASFIGYYFAFTVLFFIIVRFIHGISWGLASVANNTVAIDIIPSTRRAEGIGYFGVTSNMAMAIAPYLGVYIYDNFGFNILITSALSLSALSIIVGSFIKVPNKIIEQKNPTISIDRFILVKALPIFGNQLFLSFGWGTLAAYAVLYGKEIGIKNAGIFFVFMAIGIILSRVRSGKLVDYGYLHVIMMVSMTLITLGFLSFSLFHSVYYYCGSALIMGLGYGTLFPALQTIYNNMAPASKRGTANSTYLTGFDLGIGIGMFFGAYLAEKYGYSKMYLFTAATAFISLLIYWFNSRRVYEKNKIQINTK
ncbi:MAG TPA: MFS transporter [Edaphocola sp.]|nr:MFS transporter [Edaphocola sp.]